MRYEYDITQHSADALGEMIYFCSEAGECSVNKVPMDQVKIFEDILNDRGREGWELVQVSFSKMGAMAFWKRTLTELKFQWTFRNILC